MHEQIPRLARNCTSLTHDMTEPELIFDLVRDEARKGRYSGAFNWGLTLSLDFRARKKRVKHYLL